MIKFTSEYIASCRKATGGPWVFQDTRQALDEIERRQAGLEALMGCFFEFETIAPNGELMASVLDMSTQLATTKARLAEYEVGFDPKVKLPKFDCGYGWVLAQMHEEQTPSMYHYSSVQNSWQDVDLDSYPTSKILRWFPLPGSKGGEA